MSQPQIVAVDPHRIKFNPTHGSRRKMNLRLKRSIEAVGMVQLPTVRTVAGGFYESIDGDVRIREAQDARLPTIWVQSVGIIGDQQALMMYLAANTVRSFDFLSECRGLAELHRGGLSASKLTDIVGRSLTTTKEMVAIGYLPQELLATIDQDNSRYEVEASPWTYRLLRELLPLRQLRGGVDPNHLQEGETLDDAYDYTEVRLAIQKVVAKEIKDSLQMAAYVAERRLALFTQRFDAILAAQLEHELEQTKQALERDYSQQVKEAEAQTAHLYEAQVDHLQEQVDELEKRYNAIVKEVAKRPEIIAEREQELQERMRQTEAERLRLISLQDRVQAEAKHRERQLQEEMSVQLATTKQELEAQLRQEYAKTEGDLKAYYSQKDYNRQMRAENSVHQMIAEGTRRLVEVQQWLLNLTSADVFKGLALLGKLETVSLLTEIRTVRETLNRAEEMIMHGQTVAS